MLDLFPFAARRTSPVPKYKLPKVAAVRFAGGLCTAACMYAITADCDCFCNGTNHQSGLRCDPVKQDALAV